jgi:CheY-like chemotaxis protein
MPAYEVMGMDDTLVSKDVILLIDSDAERMASMQTILLGGGYAVFSSPTAEAAVKLCTMIHFDLIVSRVMLPLGGMGGIALAQSPEGSKV